ncbi:MAG: hydrogenase expression/formation protein [Gammaproteobacteria bacterium]|nr:hydrogenase expression/formation protein [Gammaproteobacteria bacterium]MCF6361919.1 hydrogenase expression/formation protein [Gammaproteobacteria bacterium]
MNEIGIPIVVGPGSQPAEADGLEMDYRMPDGDMLIYTPPVLPEPEEIAGVDQAIDLFGKVLTALEAYRVEEPAVAFSLDGLDEHNVDLVNQMLGSGEVSMTYQGEEKAQIQESVLAGVWRIQFLGPAGEIQRDVIEVAGIPRLIRESTFAQAATSLKLDSASIPDNVYNAPPLLSEIAEKMPAYRLGDEPHVINLSLLPHTNEDIEYLSAELGVGPTVILSRGYGNCRVSSTTTRNVWWVQYFNSQDTLILNTLEVSDVPNVACAAQEDIEDSAQRLREILEVYA